MGACLAVNAATRRAPGGCRISERGRFSSNRPRRIVGRWGRGRPPERRLPAVVAEGPVGLGHLVGVLALLHRGAAVVRGVEQFGGQLLGHGVFAAVAGGVDQPADGQGAATVGTDLDRHLVGGAADATRPDLDRRGDVVERGVEGLDRGLLILLVGEDVEGAVDDVLGDGLLALVHHVIHELGDDEVAELGIRQDFTLLGAVTTRHGGLPSLNLVGAGGLLRTLGAVVRTALLAVLDALGVQHAAQDVVAHARKVLDAAAADQDHRVLLQVVAFARDVAHRLDAGGQAHLGDLTQRRVRLLRGGGVDAGADAAALRAALQGRDLVADRLGGARLADQLVDRGHRVLVLFDRWGRVPFGRSAPVAFFLDADVAVPGWGFEPVPRQTQTPE